MRNILSFTKVPAVQNTAFAIVCLGFIAIGLKLGFGIDVLN